jgi:hypothetical protein
MEAARELRAALGKKRGKRKGRPFYQRTWLRAAGILVGLAVVAVLAALALRPPSAEKLFQRAEKLMASSDPDDWTAARDGPIREYLRRYRDRDDDRTRQMIAWADKVDRRDCEQKLDKMFRTRRGLAILIKVEPEKPVEELALKAALDEDSGDLETAEKCWLGLKEKFAKEHHAWGLVADHHLGELKEVAMREQQLRGQIDKEGNSYPDFKPRDDAERLAADALRNEVLKQVADARAGWEKLKKQTERQGDQRLWYLLAAYRLHKLDSEKQEK